MTKNLAILIGFSAILLWSTIIELLIKVSANIGADLAVLFMYSLSAVLLFTLFRIRNLKQILRTYLYGAKVSSVTKLEDLGHIQLSKSFLCVTFESLSLRSSTSHLSKRETLSRD